MQSLYKLVHSAQQGDSEAIKEVMGNFDRFVHKRLSQTTLLEQQDLKQELMILIWEKTKAYRLDEVPGFEEFIKNE